MNKSVTFPVFIVMRNGHIMPPGLHMYRANAEATAAREEGEVVPLYPPKPPAEWMALIPSNWCDPLLTGPNAVLGEQPWGCPQIEALLNGLRERFAKHAPAVQAGMVMVPVEPTEEMLEAGKYGTAYNVWKAMIAAAKEGK